MKNTVCFLIIFFSLFLNFSHAQNSNNNIVLGEVLTSIYKKSFDALEILTDDQEYFYTLETPEDISSYLLKLGKPEYRSFAKYSIEKLKPVKTVPIDLSYENIEREFEFATVLKDEIYLFTSFKNQKKKKTFLFAEKINKESLKATSNIKMVAEIDYSKEGRYNKSNFHYTLSEDKSKIMIGYNLLNHENEILNGGFKVFDHDFKELVKFEDPFPINKKAIFKFSEYCLSNNGEISILGKHYQKKRSLKKETKIKSKYFLFGPSSYRRYPKYQYQAFHINNQGLLSTYKFNELENYITDLTIKFSPEGKLIAAGLYAKKGRMKVKGSFTCEINSTTNSLINIAFHELDLNYLTLGYSKREKSRYIRKLDPKKKSSKTFYTIDKLNFYKDGGHSLMVEPHFKFHTTVGNKSQYNDIWVIKHNNSGEISWKTKVLKRQYVYGTTTFGSFASEFFNENINLLYYVTPVSNFSKYTSPRNFSLHTTTVNKNGEKLTKMLNPGNNKDIFFRIEFTKSLKSGEIIHFLNSSEKYRFLKLKN